MASHSNLYIEAEIFAQRYALKTKPVTEWMKARGANSICDFARMFPGEHAESMAKAVADFWEFHNPPAAAPVVERTAAGPQYVLPCVPKSSLGDLAQRMADNPLKAHTSQKPCDVGLFSDAAAQIDLEDLTRRKA